MKFRFSSFLDIIVFSPLNEQYIQGLTGNIVSSSIALLIYDISCSCSTHEAKPCTTFYFERGQKLVGDVSNNYKILFTIFDNLVNSIQVSYSLWFITTTQPIQGHCNYVLHMRNNLECVFFFHVWAQSLTQKIESNEFYLSLVSKFFLFLWT